MYFLSRVYNNIFYKCFHNHEHQISQGSVCVLLASLVHSIAGFCEWQY